MPALSMLRVLNVAVPFIADTFTVPASVPLLGLLPIPMTTLAVLVVAFPAASWICTVTAGEIAVAETVLVG